ncbi:MULTISPECIES: MFS transporter [unclassified Streptomyces]|uniref:MFS transporter n=1 Tax=unclassified Streptomyces TaxID=2593676 RepID=UPI002DD9CD2F|nr:MULTISPECIES: MFS transporter [unclassified Streptomyces]WSA96114.1 MFS transporter [Streptomyces sp. NBC_01795]WSB80529.1 MFS transporter [Streptomyces sp. NBC_01775]WSS39973.1 MFS transporter [Streptomyces sp. NBC_01187]
MAKDPTGSSPAKRRLPGRYWRLAVLSGMASYLDSGLLIGISVSLAIWRESFGMGVWMAGAISAIVTFSIALGSLVGGWLADLLGRRRVYNLDILCYSCGALTITLAPNDKVLLTGVIIAGLAAGADLPTSLAVVSEAVPAWARGRLVAFTQVMWTVGIAVTTLLGFALSAMGQLGTRLIIGHLALAALVTWALRSRLAVLSAEAPENASPEAPSDDIPMPYEPGSPSTVPAVDVQGAQRPGRPALKSLLHKSVLLPMAATFAFYVVWGLGANTFGQFGTYFLVTVSDASQSLATGLNLAFLPVALAMGLVFVRVADTAWRDRLFLVAAVVQTVAFAIPSFTGGAVLSGMLAYCVLYQLSNPLAGEANYKVWSQLLLPADTRGTSQGLTYALSRATFALAAFFTPALLEFSPSLLLWSITACMAVAMAVGIFIIRVLVPRAAAAPASAQPEAQLVTP